ncbi:MAG: ABC transporter permease, partial [Planctomycetota bacterium JB042]
MTEIPWRLVFRNLFKHPVRSILTLLSMTVAVFLLCLMQALVTTLDAAVEEAESDRFVVQSAVSLFVLLPESYRQKLTATEGVESVCALTWFGGYYQKPENFFAQFATQEETLGATYPELSYVEGSEAEWLADGRGCIVGDRLAETYGFALGDSIPIVGNIFRRTDGAPWAFTVRGIYTSSTANLDRSTLFFHEDLLFESLRSGAATGPRGVGVYYVRTSPGADPVAVMSRIDEEYANGPQRVQSTPESVFQAQFVSMIGNVPLFVTSLGGGVLFAILLAVVNTMLMAAREQVHDVGVLKALGFGDAPVFVVFLGQGLLLCLLGGGAGVLVARGLSDGIARAAGNYFPGFEVGPGTVALGLALSAGIGLLAAA